MTGRRPPVDRCTDQPLADVTEPQIFLGDLVLAPGIARDLECLVREVRDWPVLDRLGVPHRNKIALYGPPGCGKSSIAAAIAHELRRPPVTVRVDGVTSSCLGETAANIRRVIEYAESSPYVLLFDGFDPTVRDGQDGHGRVVNALLRQIETYEGPSILVYTANRVLGDAPWRRFHEILEVPAPTPGEMAEVIRRALVGRADGTEDCAAAAVVLAGLPHAAGQFAAHAAVRNAVRGGRRTVNWNDLRLSAEATAARPWCRHVGAATSH